MEINAKRLQHLSKNLENDVAIFDKTIENNEKNERRCM